jgi:hypothetical protein
MTATAYRLPLSKNSPFGADAKPGRAMPRLAEMALVRCSLFLLLLCLLTPGVQAAPRDKTIHPVVKKLNLTLAQRKKILHLMRTMPPGPKRIQAVQSVLTVEQMDRLHGYKKH